MRGSQRCCAVVRIVQGIIPAHAGLTSATLTASGEYRDHPRACGAHDKQAELDHGRRGSSPRMRGSQGKVQGRVRDLGIIPAHAGLTWSSLHVTSFIWDHPRACGAHFLQ